MRGNKNDSTHPYDYKRHSGEVNRLRFPVKFEFAMLINKSQVTVCDINIENPCFHTANCMSPDPVSDTKKYNLFMHKKTHLTIFCIKEHCNKHNNS